MTTAQNGGKIVSLTNRPPLPPGMLLILISVRGWVDTRAIVRSEGLCQWKIPTTPSEIEPVTFRFEAQYLNHCATISGPNITVVNINCKEETHYIGMEIQNVWPTYSHGSIHVQFYQSKVFVIKLVVFIVCILLGISAASDCDLPTFRNPWV
jgi:hypothetical protein